MNNGPQTTADQSEDEEREASLAEYDQANAEGRAAYKAGLSVVDCPYPEAASTLREGWLDGYHG